MCAEASPVILQVLPSLRSGGAERGAVDIAIAAKKAGFASFVASAGGLMVHQLTRAGITHFELPLDSKNPFTIWRNIYRLRRIIKGQGVNIVHARSRAPAWSAYFAARGQSCHFITTFHGLYKTENKWKIRYNEIMTRGEKVIAISRFIAKHIVETYQTPKDRIHIIHRGVDEKVFDPEIVAEHRITALLERWSVPDALPVILCPARITRWKGHLFLLEALKKLPHRNYYCVFLGDDKDHERYRSELEVAIIDGGLGGNVRIANPIFDMPAAYMASSVVVAPSIEPEAFGRVPVEAQMMGKPIITTNHGGTLETVIDGDKFKRTGWLVSPKNPEELKTAIEESLKLTETERKLLASRAIAHARQNFSNIQMMDKTLNLYREFVR